MEATGSRYRGDIVRGRWARRGTGLPAPPPALPPSLPNRPVSSRMEGQGSYTLPTGTEYRGALRDGMFDGEGELLFPNGGTYRAVWHRGVPTQVSRVRGASPRGTSPEATLPGKFWGEICEFLSPANFLPPSACEEGAANGRSHRCGSQRYLSPS